MAKTTNYNLLIPSPTGEEDVHQSLADNFIEIDKQIKTNADSAKNVKDEVIAARQTPDGSTQSDLKAALNWYYEEAKRETLGVTVEPLVGLSPSGTRFEITFEDDGDIITTETTKSARSLVGVAQDGTRYAISFEDDGDIVSTVTTESATPLVGQSIGGKKFEITFEADGDLLINEYNQPMYAMISDEVIAARTDEEDLTSTTLKARLDSMGSKITTNSDQIGIVNENLDDRGINVKKEFNVVGNGSTDDTATINAAIDWAHSQSTKVKLVFPKGVYKYGGSKIIDATKVCFEGKGSVTLDVTASVSANNPYIFNFQNTKVDSNEINWNQPVFDGFNFRTTLTKEVLLTKDTVLFAFETPHSLGSKGANTHNSAQMMFKNITGRWIPYFYTFGNCAFLLRFENVNHRLCKSVIKVFHPSSEQGVINKTLNSESRYHSDYGENISFHGGMIGGSWETTISNKLQAGSLAFHGVSIDYWTGGTFFTGGHNGMTSFSQCHIESTHNPSEEMNPYNLDAPKDIDGNPTIKWWIELQGSHKLNISESIFYGATVSDRDTTDLQRLVNGTSSNQVTFDRCGFVNMKFTERQLSNIDKCNVVHCGFMDSIPFFRTLTTGNDNLVFNKKNVDITNIKGLENVFCPYYDSSPIVNLTDQWTNTSVKVEWDNTEKAFKITKLGTAISQVVDFMLSVPHSGNYLNYSLDIKASGTVTGTMAVKLRGGAALKRYAMDGTTLKSYYDPLDVMYIQDLVTSTAVPVNYTTYTLTTANSLISKLARYKSYIIEVDVNGLAVNESIFVKNVIAQVL